MAKYAAKMGLILLIVDIFWLRATIKETGKEKAALEHELNTLKAKLFDIQEASRNTTYSSGTTPKA